MAVALALLMLLPAGALTGGAARAICADAAAPHHVAVVVQHGDGATVTTCVSFTADTITAEAALNASGVNPVYYDYGGSLGKAVCQLDGEPAAPPGGWTRNNCPGGGTYWAAWLERGGGDWRSATRGVSSTYLSDGDGTGFRYGGGGNSPPPPAASAGCPSPAAAPTAGPSAPSSRPGTGTGGGTGHAAGGGPGAPPGGTPRGQGGTSAVADPGASSPPDAAAPPSAGTTGAGAPSPSVEAPAASLDANQAMATGSPPSKAVVAAPLRGRSRAPAATVSRPAPDRYGVPAAGGAAVLLVLVLVGQLLSRREGP